MGLKAILDSLDDVDENLRDMYRETEGGQFILDVEGMVPEDQIESHEKTKGLKSALDKEREARKQYEKRARELESKAGKISDEDLEELEQLRAAKQKAEEERRRRNGEFEKWRDEIQKEHKQEVEARENRIRSLQEQIRQDRIGRQIAEACAEHGATNTAVMQAFIERHVKADFDDEGQLSVAVLDPADGNRMLDSEGKPLSIPGFVKKLSESKDFAPLFASRQKSGGGTPPSDRDGQGGRPSGETPRGNAPDLEKMSQAERRRYEIRQKIDEHRQAQQRAAEG